MSFPGHQHSPSSTVRGTQNAAWSRTTIRPTSAMVAAATLTPRRWRPLPMATAHAMQWRSVADDVYSGR